MEKKKEVSSKKTTTKKTVAAKKSTTKKTVSANKSNTVKSASAKKSIAKAKVAVEEEIVTPIIEEVKVEKKASKHVLFKALIISLFVAIVLSWIIPSGYFSGAVYTSSEATTTGINEMFLALFYGANYYLVQIVFLIALGVFYGVISKTKGYKSLVDSLVKFWKGKETAFVLINSLVIAVFCSMATQILPILIFVPLIISIAKKLGFSKLDQVALGFGSMMVGMIGTTSGTFGVDYINNAMGTTITSGLVIRVGILAISYIILNVLILLNNKKSNTNEIESNDVFEATATQGGKAWPYFVMFILLFIIMILGYMPWATSFNIQVFDKFNTWLTTGIKIGDYAIFGHILGNVSAFGAWDLFTISYILLIVLIFVKIFAKVKFDDALDNAIDGIKKMAVPAVLVMFAYSMFVICYWSGFTAWIIDKLNYSDNFNFILNAIGNGIATFFHVDFGYSGYSLGAFYAAKFADYTSQILTIMISMNGLVSFVAPTSVVLLVGCSMYDVSYGKWIKYIWKFVVALLALLLIMFAIMTYL